MRRREKEKGRNGGGVDEFRNGPDRRGGDRGTGCAGRFGVWV